MLKICPGARKLVNKEVEENAKIEDKSKRLIDRVYTSFEDCSSEAVQFDNTDEEISFMRYMSDEKNARCMYIKAHLKLLKLLAKYSSYKFTEDKLNQICKTLLEKYKFMEYKDILLKWLQKLSKAQEEGEELFDGCNVESIMKKSKLI